MAMNYEPQEDVVEPPADTDQPRPTWFLAETIDSRRKVVEGPVHVPDPRKKA